MASFTEALVADAMADLSEQESQKIKQYICNVCTAKFYDEDEYRKHATSHKNSRRRARKGVPRPTTVKPKPAAAPPAKPESPKTFNQAIDSVISGHLQINSEHASKITNEYKGPDENPCGTHTMAFAIRAKSKNQIGAIKKEYQNMNTMDKQGNKLHCIECGKEFTLKRTVKGTQDALPQRCTKCFMKAHMLANQKNSFKCLTCRESFENKEDLTAHMADHKKGKFECETCRKTFFDRKDLLQHIGQHTVKTTPTPTNGPGFHEKANQSITENNANIYHCNVCSRAFQRLGYLQKHMLTHNGPSPFKCLECEKTFTQKNRLHLHLLSSCGNQRFQCEKCQKNFYQKHNLMMHYLVHASNDVAAKFGKESEEVHKCANCDRVFCDWAALKQHATTHTDKEILDLRKKIEREAGIEGTPVVPSQYPTVAQMLDTPPVNRTVVQVLPGPGNRKLVQIVENSPVNQVAPSQIYHNTQVLASREHMPYHNVALTQEITSENISYPPVVHTQEVYTDDLQYQQVAHTQEISSDDVQIQQVAHIQEVSTNGMHYQPIDQTQVISSDDVQYQPVIHDQVLVSETVSYHHPVAHTQVLSTSENVQFHPVIHRQDVMRPQDSEIYEAVQHLLEDRDSVSSPELVNPYPTEVHVAVPEAVSYSVETETYVTPTVGPPPEESVEKSKFQSVVQTMCNLLNSRSGS